MEKEEEKITCKLCGLQVPRAKISFPYGEACCDACRADYDLELELGLKPSIIRHNH